LGAGLPSTQRYRKAVVGVVPLSSCPINGAGVMRGVLSQTPSLGEPWVPTAAIPPGALDIKLSIPIPPNQ
jgi:hypothetical protein